MLSRAELRSPAMPEDGQLEIDNNAAERALSVVALRRKNYLFCGSDAGEERAAQIYSLLGSAKLNGLDPDLYLHHVLERIAETPSTAFMNCCHGTNHPQHQRHRNKISVHVDT